MSKRPKEQANFAPVGLVDYVESSVEMVSWIGIVEYGENPEKVDKNICWRRAVVLIKLVVELCCAYDENDLQKIVVVTPNVGWEF